MAKRKSEHISYKDHVKTSRRLEECFSYLLDLENMKQWGVLIHNVTRTSKGPLGLHSSFDVEYRLGLMNFKLNYKISALEDNKRIVFHADSPVLSVREYFDFQQVDAFTEVKMRTDIGFKGMLTAIKPVLEPFSMRYASQGIKRLEQALTERPAFQPQTTFETIGDRLIIPKLLKLTRLGYEQEEKEFKPYVNSLKGKTAFVSDGTSHIGEQAVKGLVRLGADVCFASSHKQRGEELVKQVKDSYGVELGFEYADLSDIRQLNDVCDKLHQRYDKLSILVNNFGHIIDQRETTNEGYEKSFSSLLLSPFILTESLHDLLKNEAHSRVISLITSEIYSQPVDIDDLESKQKPYNGVLAYARAKRGLLDMCEVWARHWESEGIKVHAVNPGLVDTEQVRWGIFYPIAKTWMRKPSQAVDSILWLASSPAAEEVNGLYWLDRRPQRKSFFEAMKTPVEKQELLYTNLRAHMERSQQEKIA
jgi:NAD(P)-dependent dehydrogenase (short-subunit alcohol dehydrogenase family)